MFIYTIKNISNVVLSRTNKNKRKKLKEIQFFFSGRLERAHSLKLSAILITILILNDFDNK